MADIIIDNLNQPTTHQQDLDADWAYYDEAARAYETSQRLMTDDEARSHDQAVLEGVIDRNGFKLALQWLVDYMAEVEAIESQVLE